MPILPRQELFTIEQNIILDNSFFHKIVFIFTIDWMGYMATIS
jgi:hypothetical protein